MFAVRPNFEDSGTVTAGRKYEFIRSESENWRIFREEQNGEEEDGGWRLAGSRRDGERWRPHSPVSLKITLDLEAEVLLDVFFYLDRSGKKCLS
ncbi:hypothetical protein JD844_007081 [Phrynosoma platyrhinos]|uniref:Uncharacterized protein n=1 Tax=Phrynosoma platyrhinos TaxID=52577 RepID=A0ABQ7T2T0_PHRPL|nr:hypothetical protein JD844_007081 [Phrynosoma platyrhinos]